MTAAAGQSLRWRKIESFLDIERAGLDETYCPKKEEYTKQWHQLNVDQKKFVAAAIPSRTVGDITTATGIPVKDVSETLAKDATIIKIIVAARLLSLPSDTAKELFLETLITTENSRELAFEQINKVVRSDKQHLQELASKLNVSGDGKREILKELAAYGMQVKKVESAIIDPATGIMLSPAVYSLADPRMAFNSVQELNRMDHEYGSDDKATSSVEGQADRIRRLRGQITSAAKREAKVVDGVIKTIPAKDLTSFPEGEPE